MASPPSHFARASGAGRDPRARAEAFLAIACTASRVAIQGWERLSGGAIQENVAIDVVIEGGPLAGQHAWVLRTDAPSAVAVSRSRSEEFEILRAAQGAGVRVPEPLFACHDGEGPDFFVMRRMPGVAAGHRLSRDDGLVPDRAALARELGENLARLHRLTPPAASLHFLGAAPVDFARATVATYLRDLDVLGAVRGEAWPALEWGLAWCARNAPDPLPACLLHRDYRTGNYLVHEGRLSAVLDWEFAGWGDPREDIGWMFARCWRFARPDREAGGVGFAADFLAGYAAAGGRRTAWEETLYWQAMAHLRWAVIALQQVERHRSGSQRSLELALTAHIVPDLENEILALTAGAP
ncbi:MAG: phosphotransferase family protein [Betaproteobacteria bacterium]|nr:phosphotransferase family protein [Betaproteobacteria bacterium]